MSPGSLQQNERMAPAVTKISLNHQKTTLGRNAQALRNVMGDVVSVTHIVGAPKNRDLFGNKEGVREKY